MAGSREEELEFPGASGVRLAGVLRWPGGTPRGGVVLSHCFTCSKDLHTMTRLSRGLASAGWAVLRFDFAGIGGSGGELAEEPVSRNVRDVVAAAGALRERVDGPLCLFGHSLGGAATLLAVSDLPDVASVAVLAAPENPSHLADVFRPAAGASDGDVTATIGGQRFTVSREFLDDLDRHDQEGAVARLGVPLLVVHAPDDTVVAVADGEANFARARQPKAFVPLIGADHLVSDRGHAMRLAAVVGDWFAVTTSG